MSRRRQKPPRRIQIPIQELSAIVERTRSGPLPEAEHATLKAAVETLARLTAELELFDFTIGVAPRPEPPPPLAEVSAELPLVFAEPKRLIHLEWAVNVVSREDAADEPEHRPVSILVYRDSAHVSRFLELTPLAAAILERLFAGDSLGAAMVSACESRQHPLDDDVLTGAARLLADLAERGVLLGARELGVGP